MQQEFCSVNLIHRSWRTWKTNQITPTYYNVLMYVMKTSTRWLQIGALNLSHIEFNWLFYEYIIKGPGRVSLSGLQKLAETSTSFASMAFLDFPSHWVWGFQNLRISVNLQSQVSGNLQVQITPDLIIPDNSSCWHYLVLNFYFWNCISHIAVVIEHSRGPMKIQLCDCEYM